MRGGPAAGAPLAESAGYTPPGHSMESNILALSCTALHLSSPSPRPGPARGEAEPPANGANPRPRPAPTGR